MKNLIELGISNVLRRCSSCVVGVSERLIKSGSEDFFLPSKLCVGLEISLDLVEICILCGLVCSFV